MSLSRASWSLGLAAALLLMASSTQAALIEVRPGDDHTKLEAAKPGDIVEIYPGTYKFRVMLTAKGTASNPIVIRAKDPSQRPIWDLAGKAVKDWPGSYTGGDRGRGAWQIRGDHYQISGIIFRNAQDVSSAGIRVINTGPVTIRDCVFANNTNGITGSSSDFLVEFSEFDGNGKTSSSGNMSHNIYIYGGKFTLRYSYLHDPREGQNFHIRAAEGLLEYNWITRPGSYPGDLMTCYTICGGSGQNAITQRLTLRGNVIIQGTPANKGQIVALFSDSSGGSSDSTGKASKFELTLLHNTIIGTPQGPGKTHKLVNMRNDGIDTAVIMHNNIIAGVGELASPKEPSKGNWSVVGKNNWIQTGATSHGTLSGTLKGSAPGFVNAAQRDYRLTTQSPCVGAAATVPGAPTREYFEDETVILQTRARATADDLGAFEEGNQATPTGPYGTTSPTPDAGVPTPDAGAPEDAGPASDAAASREDGAPAPADGASKDGASDLGGHSEGSDDGCSVASSGRGQSPLTLLLLLALFVVFRHRR